METVPEQAAECRQTGETYFHACLSDGVSPVEKGSCAIQAQRREVSVRRLPKCLGERSMEVETRQARFASNILERGPVANFAVQKLPSNLQSPEELFSRFFTRCRNSSKLCSSFFVKYGYFLRQNQEILFKTAGL